MNKDAHPHRKGSTMQAELSNDMKVKVIEMNIARAQQVAYDYEINIQVSKIAGDVERHEEQKKGLAIELKRLDEYRKLLKLLESECAQ